MKNQIEILPYSPDYPQMFRSEALRIKQAMGSNFCEIYHIGSTAIPDMPAKPIIDILVSILDIEKVDACNIAMEELGYSVKGENGMAFRRFFQKITPQKYHVHVFEKSDTEIARHILFRDWMRTHPQDAAEYAKLKKTLAKKFPSDILKYCFGKDTFVAAIDAKDGYVVSVSAV